MKIAAHVLAYNVNRFLPSVLKNIEPHVDKIYIAHSHRPWGYVKSSRENSKNPTTLDFIEKAANNSSKIEIIHGDWLTEEDMRNACLEQAIQQGYDWLIIQDADEFYTEHSWAQIKTNFQKYNHTDLLVTTWYNFWKSSQFVLAHSNGSIKGTNAGFAIKCKPNVRFTRKRLTNAESVKIIDCPCFHYGYVMTDDEMSEKLSTWGHSTEFNNSVWYTHKWKNWNENVQFLHPTNPNHWLKAIRFPMEQPPFAEEFSIPVNQVFKRSFSNLSGENWYNLKVKIGGILKGFKNLLKSILTT